MTAYISAEDVMSEMPDVDWSGKYREQLTALTVRASRLIDRITGREEGAYKVSAATVRYYDGSGCAFQWVDEMAAAPTEIAMDTTGGRTAYTALAAADYMLWPYAAAVGGRPYTRIDLDTLNGDYALFYRFPQAVKVTAKWGYSTDVPGDVEQAVLVQTVRWFKRAQQAFQDTGAIFELGQLRYVKQVDPDVALIVEHLRRVTV